MVVSNQFQTNLAKILNQGNFNERMKLPAPPKPTVANFNTPYESMPATGGSNDLEKLRLAIRGQESSNDYRAINPSSGALGGYQVLPSNLFGGSEWDRKALGRDVSRDEFLNSPAIQDAIARWQLNNYLKKFGAAGAAVAWYGGEGAVSHMHDRTKQAGGYPSLYDYWSSVLRRMG